MSTPEDFQSYDSFTHKTCKTLLYFVFLCTLYFLAKYPGQVEEAEKKTLQTLQMILKEQDERGTGCSLNIVFFPEDFKIFRTLAFLCLSSVSVSVHNGRANTSAAAELAEFIKITIFKGKHNI